MTSPKPLILKSFRTLALLVMAFVMVTFTSAQSRVAVLTVMAEEAGASRFYEDKACQARPSVVRLAQLRQGRRPYDTRALRPQAVRTASADPTAQAERRFCSWLLSELSPRAPPAAA